jgi:archaetidylinositol phosphate synthase
VSHDTWMHRGARTVIRPLVGTPVTPNHVTTLRLLSGVAAAGAFAAGSPGWQAWGGVIFLASMVLDRADGELARLTGASSPWGHRYDLVTDAVCNVLAFVGLGIGLREGLFGSWSIAMGLIAGAAVAAILLLVMRQENRRGLRSAELRVTARVDPDDALVAVPLLVWLGLADWMILAAAIGAPAFALYALLRFRRGLRAGTAVPPAG